MPGRRRGAGGPLRQLARNVLPDLVPVQSDALAQGLAAVLASCAS